MLLSGLAQMPGFNAIAPGLIDLFGGRQTARTLHVVGMLVIFAFVIVHVVQVFVAGATNEIRAMITGKYALPARARPEQDESPESHGARSRPATRQTEATK